MDASQRRQALLLLCWWPVPLKVAIASISEVKIDFDAFPRW